MASGEFRRGMQSNRWKSYGLCEGMDVNLFFERFEDDTILRRSVREMCDSCPVKKVCYLHGQNDHEVGVWGGIYWDGKGNPHEEYND